MATAALLPPEDLAIQLGNIETIVSVYGGQDAVLDDAKDGATAGADDNDDLVMSEADEAAIRALAQFLALPLAQLGDVKSTQLRDGLPQDIVLGLRLDPPRDEEEEQDVSKRKETHSRAQGTGVILEARFPLRRRTGSEQEASDVAKRGKLHALWPSWTVQSMPGLSAQRYTSLCARADEASKQVVSGTTSAQGETTNGEAAPGVALDGDDGASYLLSIAEAITEALLDIDSMP